MNVIKTILEAHTSNVELKDCSLCGKPLAKEYTLPNGTKKILPIMCDCMKEKLADQKRREQALIIDKNRSTCFRGRASRFIDATFDNDEGYCPELSKACRKFSANFKEALHKQEHFKDRNGLLLYGRVGTGKSYMAAAICNEVINQGFTALYTTFAELEMRIRGNFNGKEEALKEISKPSLVVFDDLGAERASDYMKELVFTAINTRYQSNKPMIVTTNLTQNEITAMKDIDRMRIYDRILDCCIPIEAPGRSIRRKLFAENNKDVKDWLTKEEE